MSDRMDAAANAGDGTPGEGSAHHVNHVNKGFATLAGDDFSVLAAVGGVRGAIESVLPSLVFIVLFVVTTDLRLTLIVTAALCAVEIVARLAQRQSAKAALMGSALVALCLIWAWRSNDAKNFYMPGFIINAFWLVVLVGTLAIRVPGIGAMVEFFRRPPSYMNGGADVARPSDGETGGSGETGEPGGTDVAGDEEAFGASMRAWLDGWRSDSALWRAYMAATVLWVGVFAIRLGVEVPLYLAQNVAWLGTMRILLGMPLFAVAIWATWLIVASPIQRHARLERQPAADGAADR